MDKITVAFDVDGTLIGNGGGSTVKDGHFAQDPVANEEIRSLLIILSKFKNIRVIVWSGGGELYARQVVASLGLQKYVDGYASKNYLGRDEDGKAIFSPSIRPDIAIDDIQSCRLGHFNLIVKQK